MPKNWKTPKAVAAAKGVSSNRSHANADLDVNDIHAGRNVSRMYDQHHELAHDQWDGPVLWECKKSRRVLELRERIFKGHRFLDLRERPASNPDGRTHKGVTIPLGQASSLGAVLLNFPPSDV